MKWISTTLIAIMIAVMMCLWKRTGRRHKFNAFSVHVPFLEWSLSAAECCFATKNITRHNLLFAQWNHSLKISLSHLSSQRNGNNPLGCDLDCILLHTLQWTVLHLWLWEEAVWCVRWQGGGLGGALSENIICSYLNNLCLKIWKAKQLCQCIWTFNWNEWMIILWAYCPSMVCTLKIKLTSNNSKRLQLSGTTVNIVKRFIRGVTLCVFVLNHHIIDIVYMQPYKEHVPWPKQLLSKLVIV